MPRRTVRRSDAFLSQARRLFPPGGSAEGRPSFEQFERGPHRGAETALSLSFEAHPEAIEGIGSLRFVVIPPTPWFGPIAVFACVTTGDEVELLSIIEDEGYWAAIGTDPPNE